MITDKKTFTIFLLSLSLFVIGFIFNEDSSGGGKLDFELHEWGNYLKFKSGIIDSLTSIEYESSRMPLFLILNAFNPFDTINICTGYLILFLIFDSISFYISIRTFKKLM